MRERKKFKMVSAKGKQRVSDIMAELPAKAIAGQTGNMAIKACCRDSDNLTHEYFHAENDPSKEVTRTIMQCDVCSCKHYRIGGTTVRK